MWRCSVMMNVRGVGVGGNLLISLAVLMCGLIASSGLMNSVVSLIGLHHSWGWGAGRGKLNQSCRKLLSVVMSHMVLMGPVHSHETSQKISHVSDAPFYHFTLEEKNSLLKHVELFYVLFSVFRRLMFISVN